MSAGRAYLLFAALVALGRPASYNAPAGGDLGQYMYAGGVVLDGGFPYVDAANNKGPANFLLFAALRLVAGDSVLVVRIALVLATALAALAIMGIVAHHGGRAAGLLAGIIFSLLSSAAGFEGPAPNNTHFGLVPMVGAWYFATRRDRHAPLVAGGLLALAVWLNPAFAVAGPIVAWELLRDRPGRGRRAAEATAGAAAVTVPIVVWLAVGGALDDMVTQVFGKVSATVAARATGSAPESPLADAPLDFLLELPAAVLWLTALTGCAVAWRDRGLRPLGIAAAVWIGLGWLRVEAASYQFDNQYFPVLAGIAIGLAAGIAAIWPANGRAWAAALVVVPLTWVAVIDPQLRQLALPAEARGNGFAEPLADFVEANTSPGSRIVVAEFDPQVYWFADRRSSSRFFDSFGLAGRDEYVAERRRDLAENPPAAIAAVPGRQIDPDLEALIDRDGYVLAYDDDGARVWLRP